MVDCYNLNTINGVWGIYHVLHEQTVPWCPVKCKCPIIIPHPDPHAFVLEFLSFSITARPSCEYYRQVYFVHSGLQDESIQLTISKLP